MPEETTNQFSESEVEEWFDDEDEPSEETPLPATDPATKYAKSQLRVVRETKEYQLD